MRRTLQGNQPQRSFSLSMAAKKLLKSNDNVTLLKGIPDGKRIEAPTPPERRTLWLLLAGGVLSVGIFAYWFITEPLPGYWPLYLMLVVTISFKLLRLLHEWYHYAAIKVIPPPPMTRAWKVDMLTTFCAGEPYDMVIDTLKAMQAVRYPHTTYLCDEADDPYLKQVCQELGVVHVYRGEDKTNAKAGNINYALEHFATGEVAVILDPDHKPRPDFLDQVLPYFENEKVGFVQCVQAYGNQRDSLIAKGAAEHTYHFYGPMMMSMNSYGTVQAIGANCTFRRAALDSIGGHAPGLSEDMHTSMCLHSKGWQSVYVPENLSRGLVPETLSGFYKQQLKWSRGTFDLLFYKFPQLAKGFTWRQVLHYLTIPLYFLTGLIAAIDIFLPMLSLVLARTPILVDLTDMVQVVVPVLIFLVLNRLYVQKWTLDRTEKGLHFWGGVLLLSTWWVYLTGFIYAILRIKVPYIPTPKGDDLKNEWRICLPNLGVMLLGLAAIWYGLARDWSPYSWFMAGLVATNVVMLGIGVLIAQRKLIHRAYMELLDGKWARYRRRWASFRYDVIYLIFRSKKLAALLALGIGLLYGAVWGEFINRGPTLAELEQEKEAIIHAGEGFRWGIRANDAQLREREVQERIHRAEVAVSFTDPAAEALAQVARIIDRGFNPVIHYTFSEAQLPAMAFYQAILDSCYDQQLAAFFYPLTRHELACLIEFDLRLPTRTDAQARQAYQAAWQHVVAFARESNLTNLSWYWLMPAEEEAIAFYPGQAWCDGWQMTAGGPRLAQRRLARIARVAPQLAEQPLLLTAVDPDSLSQATGTWAQLYQDWPIDGVLFRSAPQAFAALTAHQASHALTVAPVRSLMASSPAQAGAATAVIPVKAEDTPAARVNILAQNDGRFQLQVDGRPFYVKGVAYNPGHDWRDGYAPLTRRILDRDFQRIKAMGANTIRRYSPSVYDRNILDAAQRHGLKVLYGFWFDPKYDYYADPSRAAAYQQEVLQRVRALKDDPTILAWSIGNETYGLIKQYTTETYMPKVRRAYLLMLESLAQDIHRIDPSRPVFSMLEHSPELSRSLAAFHRWVPSLDGVGVNTYYRSRVEQLDTLVNRYYPHKPYLVSEFGPRGYWDEQLTPLDHRYRPLEQSDLEKAQDYYQQWQQHVLAHRGHNLGGVAFCWRDRLEGSLTWFGLTDFHNRLKLGYYALHRAWSEDSLAQQPDWTDVRLVIRPFFPKEYEARLVIPEEMRDRYHITWQLVRDEYLNEVGQIEPLAHDRRVAAIHTPAVPDSNTLYRVYAYLDDGQGDVLTASAPISLPYR